VHDVERLAIEAAELVGVVEPVQRVAITRRRAPTGSASSSPIFPEEPV